ncbi:hypothetical protein [Microcoleus sp. S13_C3]|uniref:hypothetical protein n=1 Tax=Microcoleus sp. S13_C3 TaxID=3055409 RepID=UPI002FD25E1F
MWGVGVGPESPPKKYNLDAQQLILEYAVKSSQQLTLNHSVFPPLLLQSTVNSQQSTVNS